MNFIGYFITLLASFALGYLLYPMAFESTAEPEISHVHEVSVLGQSGKVKIPIDAADIKPKEIPEEARLIKPATLTDATGKLTIQMEKGAVVDIVKYKNFILSIKDKSGKFTGQVPYQDTNFISRVATNRLNLMTGYDPKAKQLEAQKRAEERERIRLARENAMAQGGGIGSVGRDDDKEEEKEEEKEKEDTGPLTKEISEEEIVTLIQDSIKGKAVSEVDFDGVTKWEAGADKETISEVEYQIGFATYEKESIFGTQPAIAKALIRNGVVAKWVYAKSGLEMP